MTLEIAILGSVEPRVTGDPVGVPAGRQRALLALLAVRAPGAVSAESAAEALWPRAAPTEALRSLRVTVSRLRRSLAAAGSVVETVASGYRLAVAADAIDARRFETQIEQARVARAAGDAAAARRLLDDALGLWRGPPLADVAFESFAQAEIARLEELRIVALEERIDARLAQGDHAVVVAELEQLSAQHPSRERLIGLLMLALYRCGRQTDALDVYTLARRRLDEELGLQPSSELQRLQEAILRHDPSLDAPRRGGREGIPASIDHGRAPEGVVTMLFTDIEGSTQLARAAGSAWPQLLAEHHALVRKAVERAGGHIDGSEGDALFAYFVDPNAALEAAIAAQLALRHHQWPQPVGEVCVRMGVHAGLVDRSATGYSGLEVHRAARVTAAGHGGQVVVSAAAHALASRFELVDLGEYRLRDFPEPERLWLLVHDDRGPGDFPPLRTEPLRPASLPADRAPTRLIGRERELHEVVALIGADGARLVTLVGPGGVGKTRLALALAKAALPRFEHGAAWVELAAVARAEHVPGTVAQALAVAPLPGETPEQALLRVLETKELLLVIDNFEHVLEAAPLVARLLAHCARLTVLATSREALDLATEHVYTVAPLALPAGDEPLTATRVEASPSGALFLATAKRHDPSLRVDDSSARAIAEICTRLDGLPLAIELAAARTRLLPPQSLAARLDTALATLASGPRDAPERQRTLRATIDWSYRLLDSGEQAAFACFAVFAGGATLEDAETITDADLDTLEGLTRKHLLLLTDEPDGHVRLGMLETVREYALERLAEDPQRERTHRQHFEHCLNVVEHAVPALDAHGHRDALRVLDREADNIRGALGWALDAAPASALRLAGRLGRYWRIRRMPVEGLRWLDAAVAAAGDEAPLADRALAELARSDMFDLPDDRGAALEAAQQALALYRRAGDEAGIADALLQVGLNAMTVPDMEVVRDTAKDAARHAKLAGDDLLSARALAVLAAALPAGERLPALQKAARQFRTIGSHRALAVSYSNVAYSELVDGRVSEALTILEEAMPVVALVGDPFITMTTVGNLGVAALLSGNFQRARDAFTWQVRLCGEYVLRPWAAEGLGGLAALAARDAEFERAARLLGAAKVLGPIGDRVIEERIERAFIAPARTRWGSSRWRHAEQAGAANSFQAAIAYATAEQPLAEPPSRLLEMLDETRS